MRKAASLCVPDSSVHRSGAKESRVRSVERGLLEPLYSIQPRTGRRAGLLLVQGRQARCAQPTRPPAGSPMAAIPLLSAGLPGTPRRFVRCGRGHREYGQACGKRHADSITTPRRVLVSVRMPPTIRRSMTGRISNRYSFLQQSSQPEQPADTLMAACAARAIASAERSMSSSVVDQFEIETRSTYRPFHVVPPSQQVPSRWTAATAARLASSPPGSAPAPG